MPTGLRAISADLVRRRIHLIRGTRVMLDAGIAAMYEVETRALVQAVRRNAARFPADFMFRLTAREFAALRSQNVISNTGRGGRRVPPYAFTEQGVAMLSSVIRSRRAVHVNVVIMRTFVRLRQLVRDHQDLARQLAALEDKYDSQFHVVFEAIRELMAPVPRRRRLIGFRTSRPSDAG